MQPEEQESLIITVEEGGERLDKILAGRFRDIKSRTYFQYLIEEGRVWVNGETVKKREKLAEGDEILIHFILTPEIGLSPEPIPLDIVYEDDALLVINKPAGMVVHPAVGNWTGTFVNALLHHCQGLEQSKDLRPGIVHRLDKETTGLLIAAKTPLVQQRLIEQFSTRQVYKEYLAICLGNPGKQEIQAPIGRHPVNRKLMAVVPNGRPAISRCETVAHRGPLSLVKIVLLTGRTHQIRVHMKHVGMAVLGDDTYGNLQANQKYGAERQMLHASRLKLEHPLTKKMLELEAPLPEDFLLIRNRIIG